MRVGCKEHVLGAGGRGAHKAANERTIMYDEETRQRGERPCDGLTWHAHCIHRRYLSISCIFVPPFRPRPRPVSSLLSYSPTAATSQTVGGKVLLAYQYGEPGAGGHDRYVVRRAGGAAGATSFWSGPDDCVPGLQQ